MYDLVIGGALVVDGLGAQPVRTDVGVKDGRIAAVGALGRDAAEVVDAEGLCLCPGFIDVHTHYDAQVTWDPTLSPSSSLGVTTVVMGNCGFGIVPCSPPANETLMRNLSVVEGMDIDALRAGIRWDFESFPDYMDFVRAQSPSLNVAVLIGHSTLRTAIMGEAASEREQPTPAELHAMRETIREALRAGAIGFASSFSPNHSGFGGVPMPSTIATEEELRALVGVMGEEGRGVFQMATGARATVALLESLGERTGRPMVMSTALTMFNEADPAKAIDILDQCAAARDRGRSVHAQVTCQPLSLDFTADNAYPFFSHDAFDRVRKADGAEKRRAFASPEFRDAFRRNLATPRPGLLFYGNWDRISVGVAARPENAELESQSLGDIARRRGCDPLDLFFDLSLAENLETVFVGKLLNADDEGVAPILRHPSGVIALSDAGAHLTFMCDAGYGLHFLSHWVRDRNDFDLVEGVRRLTSHPADLYGIPDRGRIAPGAWADLLLFDPASVGISKPLRVADLPGGATRTIREPKGMVGQWVNGVRIYRDGRGVDLPKGPGRVLDRFH